MGDTNFGWIGESRRSALHATLAAEIGEWSRAWWVRHAPAGIDVQPLEPASLADAADDLWISRNGQGALAIALAGDAAESLGRHLADTGRDDGPEWTRQVGAAALDDLAVRLWKRTGLAGPAGLVRAQADAALGQARFGACAVQASLGDLRLQLALDRGLVDRLAPPRASPRASLTARHAALAAQGCRVQAVLDFGTATLSHLSDLRVGEVLVGDCGLDEPLRLRVEGGGTVAVGSLRRAGPRRAVMLDDIDKLRTGNP